MAKATYKEIPQLINYHQTFIGNSVTALYDGNKYCVYSYDTLIGSYDYDTCEKYINERYYSQTTSRIQNILRKYL